MYFGNYLPEQVSSHKLSNPAPAATGPKQQRPCQKDRSDCPHWRSLLEFLQRKAVSRNNTRLTPCVVKHINCCIHRGEREFFHLSNCPVWILQKTLCNATQTDRLAEEEPFPTDGSPHSECSPQQVRHSGRQEPCVSQKPQKPIMPEEETGEGEPSSSSLE